MILGQGGGLQFFRAVHGEGSNSRSDCMHRKRKLSLSCGSRYLADPQSDGVREIEREIDELVYKLYGLTDAEIELIKQTYRDAGMEI